MTAAALGEQVGSATVETVLCACGCGTTIRARDTKNRLRRFVAGHNNQNGRTDTARCQNCQSEFRRRIRDDRPAQRFCSKKCSGCERKTVKDRRCEFCDAVMLRKTYKGVLESCLAYSKRHYCDRNCMAAGMLHDDPSRNAYLVRARKYIANSCGVCDGTTKLSINHINRDWKDNRPENLETLCISCHMKKHWAEPGRLFQLKANTGCNVCGKIQDRYHYGMCGKHAQRFKKYGDPHLTKKPFGPVYRTED